MDILKDYLWEKVIGPYTLCWIWHWKLKIGFCPKKFYFRTWNSLVFHRVQKHFNRSPNKFPQKIFFPHYKWSFSQHFIVCLIVRYCCVFVCLIVCYCCVFLDQTSSNNYSSYLEMVCVNDPSGGPPFWNPSFDHEINPFPPCVNLRKYFTNKTKSCFIIIIVCKVEA